MTDAHAFDAPPETTWRGRMRRTLRRHSLRAGRDTLVGLVVSALVIAGVQLAGMSDGSVAGAAEPGDDVVFSAVMVGDLMYGRHVEAVTARYGHDHPLSQVEPLLQADYVTGNLEQVITEDVESLPEADKLIQLASGPETVRALADAGFTVLALANNHIMDHGIPGLRDTLAALEDVGIAGVGAGESLDEAMEIHYEEHGDLTVATLSFTDAYVIGFIARAFQGGALSADEDRAARLIAEADANADLVITHFHWGTEYGFAPNRTQRDLAEVAAGAGADIVIGHHPHVLQRVERIDDTLVLYSLGNFVFDQGWTRTRESTVARYELTESGEARVSFVPIEVREGTPRVVHGPLAAYHRERIYQRLRSGALEWTRDGDRLVTSIDHSSVLRGDDPPAGATVPEEDTDEDATLPGVPAPADEEADDGLAPDPEDGPAAPGSSPATDDEESPA